MAGRFLLHRSKAARQKLERNLRVSDEQVARLVALATSLADRMEAMPSAGLESDRERRARVHVLRRTAGAGKQTLAARGDASKDGQARTELA